MSSTLRDQMVCCKVKYIYIGARWLLVPSRVLYQTDAPIVEMLVLAIVFFDNSGVIGGEGGSILTVKYELAMIQSFISQKIPAIYS